ncbi:MAG: sulfotransferase [Blastocatellia bacterium]|nr:sulfotransferase [Blastocatellia bacterium]
MAGLLDSHSQLEIGFELFSIDYLMGRKMPWCSRNKKERLIHDRVQAFRNACLRESLKFSGKLWGNKITSEQINGLEDHNRLNPGTKLDTLDYFFRESLTGVKIVFILRDGRTCVRSKVSRTGQSFELACERWKFSVRVYQYLVQHHADMIAVKYEDLLREPAGELSKLCEFLGVSFEPTMLGGTK